MRNTASLKLEHIAITSILAMVIALALSMINNKATKKALSSVFLFPHFIPVAVFSYFAMLFLSPTSSPIPGIKVLLLVDSRYFRLVILAMEALRNVGIPVMVAVAAYERARAGRKYAAMFKSIMAFAFLQLSSLLTFDFELMNMMVNPVVYEVADTIENYVYRAGLMQAAFGISSAAWVFRFFVQLVLTIPIYYLLKSLFKHDLFGDNIDNASVISPSTESAGLALSLVLALFPLLVIMGIFIYPFITEGGAALSSLFSKLPAFFTSYFSYLVAGLLSAVINTFVTVTLAYPLTAKRIPGRTIYTIILLILVVISTGRPPVSEYLFFRDLGILNTVLPHIVGGMFTIINVFVLKSIFNSRYSDVKTKAEQENQGELSQFFTLFIPKTWKAITAMFLIQFITIWNSYMYPLMYNSNVQLSSPMLYLRNLLMGTRMPDIAVNDPAIMKLAVIIALPSLVAFLAGYRTINAEILSGRMRE